MYLPIKNVLNIFTGEHMINFQAQVSFSENISQKRIEKAKKIFGNKLVIRIICLALFLLGGKRDDICQFLDIPKGTLFSFLTNFFNKGLQAFTDNRNRKKIFNNEKCLSPTNNTSSSAEDTNHPTMTIIFGSQKINFNIPPIGNEIIIEPSNNIQFKTILLSFMSSGFFSTKQASSTFGLTERRVRELSRMLKRSDVYSLIDKRQGQQKDYVVDEKIKSELIQQYVYNIVSGRSTSSKIITNQINKACVSKVSDRTIRHHISKLGLKSIRYSLPNLLDQQKKTSKK